MFQDAQWVPETMKSTELYKHYIFPLCIHTHIRMIKFIDQAQ